MRILLIDDHPLILAAMESVLSGLSASVRFTGVETAAEAMAQLQRGEVFDLALLDLNLGAVSGFEVLEMLRAQYPALPVVVVAASDQSADMLRCIDAGAMGYVPKSARNELLFEAVHLVMSGGIYIPPIAMGADGTWVDDLVGGDPAGQISEDSRSAMLRNTPPTRGGATPGSAAAAVPGPTAMSVSIEALGLTPRQTQVLELLLQGHSNKSLARELKLSVETVKDHVAAVLRSLGVTSRTQAVLAISQMQQDGAPMRSLRP